MKREVVESSAVDRVGYDEKRHILEIEYTGGRVYQYFDVPPMVYRQLRKAPSIGAFVNEEIIGAYQYMPL